MTNPTPGYAREIPKNLVEMAHEETGQWLNRDELETWVFRRFQRLEQRIKWFESEHESKVRQNVQLMRERDQHRAAEEMQIALREKAEQERDVLRSIVDQFKAATTRASMNGYGQDDVHHDDSWIDELDDVLTRTRHYDAKRRHAEAQQ